MDPIDRASMEGRFPEGPPLAAVPAPARASYYWDACVYTAKRATIGDDQESLR
jgi:hypothetical protein